MAVKKTVSEPARLVNPDGSLAPRPGAGYDPLAPTAVPRSLAPGEVPPLKARQQWEQPAPAGDTLPFISVARQRVGARIGALRQTLTHIDRELEVSSPIGTSGQINQYQLDRINGLREHAESVRAEIEHLNSLSDHECQLWAKEHGAR